MGAVGPYFVGTAIILISVGAVCFCKSGSLSMSAHELFIKPLGYACQSKSYGQLCPILGSRHRYVS